MLHSWRVRQRIEFNLRGDVVRSGGAPVTREVFIDLHPAGGRTEIWRTELSQFANVGKILGVTGTSERPLVLASATELRQNPEDLGRLGDIPDHSRALEILGWCSDNQTPMKLRSQQALLGSMPRPQWSRDSGFLKTKAGRFLIRSVLFPGGWAEHAGPNLDRRPFAVSRIVVDRANQRRTARNSFCGRNRNGVVLLSRWPVFGGTEGLL